MFTEPSFLIAMIKALSEIIVALIRYSKNTDMENSPSKPRKEVLSWTRH